MATTSTPGWRSAVLWASTGLLALLFLVAGGTKLVPHDIYVLYFERWGYSMSFLYAVGLFEIVCALALLWPKTTWAAAAGLVGLMLGALGTHLVHAEWGMALVPLALAALSALVVYERRPDASSFWRSVKARASALWPNAGSSGAQATGTSS